MAQTRMASLRLPPDLDDRLRAVAEAKGESLSDLIRDAALRYLGECPTCRQPVPQNGAAGGGP